MLASYFLNAVFQKCVFCNPDPYLEVFSTKHFVVLHDPFAIIPGHLLISSKEHFSCLAEAVSVYPVDYHRVLRKTKYLITSKFGCVLRYEHGRAGHCMPQKPNSRLCHHFHEHLIPARLDINNQLEQKFRGYTFESEDELPELFARYGDYLFFENADGLKKFYVANQNVPPHYLRTLVATQLGHPERQNWEKYSSCQFLMEGKVLIAQGLQPNKVA